MSDSEDFMDETSTIKASTWVLEDAIKLVRLIEPVIRPFGFHSALGGGVLQRGSSAKDVDIMLYQRSHEVAGTFSDVLTALKTIGFGDKFYLCKGDKYADPTFGDFKSVYVTEFFGKRVDLFFFRFTKRVEVDAISSR